MALAVAVAAALIGIMFPAHTPPVSAQVGCAAETEPNDTELDATTTETCLAGTLTSGDQDLAIWTLDPADAAARWTLTLQGVPGTQTLLQILAIVSDRGDPLRPESTPLIELVSQPDDTAAVTLEDLILPSGQYLVALARSGLPGGGEPSTFDYRIALEPGEPWPTSADIEPNDDPATAQELDGAFEVSGERQGSKSDNYVWTVPEAGRWDISVAGPHGETMWLDLQDADGSTLASATAKSVARLYDLALQEDAYRIRVRETGTEPDPYVLSATTTTVEADAEPNDDTATAVVVFDGEPVRGRLAKDGDADRFTLTVPPGDPMLRDVRMLWRNEMDRTLCLLDSEGSRAACARAAEGLSLPNLLLAPGEHTFDVSGVSDPDDVYLLRIDPTGPAAADFEAEPNDTIETASLLDVELGMRARGGPDDTDLFRLHLDGEPQLWDLDLAGTEIKRVELMRASGGLPLASADISDDGASASLSDLYLVPGDHWIRVDSSGPEYSLAATPLGPPDPDGEREPNDDVMRAQRYHVGARRVGRLPYASDRDVYRFSLAAPQHIRLRLEQPADAATEMVISAGGETLQELSGIAAGETIEADLWLAGGDHFVELIAEQPSEERYELTSEMLDPFATSADREPNDRAPQAGPIPASLAWSGRSADPDDPDWYTIPPLPAPSTSDPLRIRVTGERPRVTLEYEEPGSDATERLTVATDADGSFVAEDVPDGLPLRMSVRSETDYEVSIEGAGLEPAVSSPPTPVELEWALDTDAVAAYWPQEQWFEASLGITNSGTEPVALDLATRSSDENWRATLEQDQVEVPAGGSITIPAIVTVAPDAWSSDAVRLSAAAFRSGGAPASASVDVASSTDAAPVQPRQGWAVPQSLLGGLNVASLGLGAVPGGDLDAEREALLFDGVTPDGGGFTYFLPDADGLPLELTVDLAGDEPVPVVATILNLQARDGNLSEMPHDFELLLSRDGQTWDPVLEGSLSPRPIDQVFMLDEPVPASFAKLRLTSMFTELRGYLSLGEWKVIAAPATPAPGDGLDIAAPAVGGHVVTFQPFLNDETLGLHVLDADLAREALDLGESRSLELVIGFGDARAAQISSLGWLDPDGSQADTRLERAEVESSLIGPAGPWARLGTWELQRSADGSVDPFALPDGTWARYLRIRGAPPTEATEVELPGQVLVTEREIGPDYRSIVGEWGYRSPDGPFEWSDAAGLEPWTLDEDAADSAEQPTPLIAGVTRHDITELGIDDDWYRMEVPIGDNSLEIALSGRPSVRVEPQVFDAGGEELSMAVTNESDGSIRYRADVEPGASYDLRIAQPPVSAVFAFDTSPSMDPFLDMVIAGLRSFLADVEPGREAVTIVPFEETSLVEGWEDDPYVLQDAFDNHVVSGNGSSGAEAGLIGSTALLEEREGGKAILLVTDAETSTYDQTPELWTQLTRIRPIIFSVHIGGALEPVAARQRMQDWAAAGGGHYSYPTTHGEMDRAFERMATWLRRPATYALSYTTEEIRPARLRVQPASDQGGGQAAAALAPGVGVEIILDTSGSMRKRLDGKRRIQIAKASIRRLLNESLPEGVPIAIRTFGRPGKGKKAGCATTLALPLQPLHRPVALSAVDALEARKNTGTPIAAALRAVPDDLAGVDGLRSVVLVTDGNASCGEEPDAAIQALLDAGVDVKLDIVGFALEDDALKAKMAGWARAGGGAFLDANSAKELSTSITKALSAPFRAYAPDGTTVATGTVGGDAVEVDPGTYRVEVLTDPIVVFDLVELGSGASVTLELPSRESEEGD